MEEKSIISQEDMQTVMEIFQKWEKEVSNFSRFDIIVAGVTMMRIGSFNTALRVKMEAASAEMKNQANLTSPDNTSGN